jgi:hypothetical protein
MSLGGDALAKEELINLHVVADLFNELTELTIIQK